MATDESRMLQEQRRRRTDEANILDSQRARRALNGQTDESRILETQRAQAALSAIPQPKSAPTRKVNGWNPMEWFQENVSPVLNNIGEAINNPPESITQTALERSVVPLRGSGLTFDKDGRPYITVNGRRVYQGDTASEQVSRVTGPDGKELIADPENPGFLLTEDGSSVRGDLTGGAGPISEDKDTGFVRPSDPKPPSTPAPPVTEAPKTRTNENGIEQKGTSLSSSDLSSLGILDAARFWEGGTHVSGGDTPPLGSKVINVGGKDMELSGDALIEYEEAVTEAGSTGLVPQATASKPAAPGTPWSKVELTEDDEQYVSPIYENAARNAARSAFLDAPAGKGAMGAINARNRAVGGDDAHGFNVGGKHYQWADGVDQKQRTEAMYQLSGGVGNTREGFEGFAQQFLKDYMQKPEVKDTQEAGAGLVAHTPEKSEFPGYSSPTVSTPSKGPAITTDEDETAEFSYNSSKPSYASQRNTQEIGFN